MLEECIGKEQMERNQMKMAPMLEGCMKKQPHEFMGGKPDSAAMVNLLFHNFINIHNFTIEFDVKTTAVDRWLESGRSNGNAALSNEQFHLHDLLNGARKLLYSISVPFLCHFCVILRSFLSFLCFWSF